MRKRRGMPVLKVGGYELIQVLDWHWLRVVWFIYLNLFWSILLNFKVSYHPHVGCELTSSNRSSRSVSAWCYLRTHSWSPVSVKKKKRQSTAILPKIPLNPVSSPKGYEMEVQFTSRKKNKVIKWWRIWIMSWVLLIKVGILGLMGMKRKCWNWSCCERDWGLLFLYILYP